jgi:hypothetical protein
MDAIDTKPTIEEINIHYTGQIGMTANLDVQYALALAYPTPVIYYQGSGNGVRFGPGGTQPVATSSSSGSTTWLQR